MALPTMLDSTDRAYFQNNVYTVYTQKHRFHEIFKHCKLIFTNLDFIR